MITARAAPRERELPWDFVCVSQRAVSRDASVCVAAATNFNIRVGGVQRVEDGIVVD